LEATPPQIYLCKGGSGTELAGVAAKEGAGCKALVVGVVCLGVIDDQPPATLHLFVTNPSYFLYTSQSYFKCGLIQDP